MYEQDTSADVARSDQCNALQTAKDIVIHDNYQSLLGLQQNYRAKGVNKPAQCLIDPDSIHVLARTRSKGDGLGHRHIQAAVDLHFDGQQVVGRVVCGCGDDDVVYAQPSQRIHGVRIGGGEDYCLRGEEFDPR